MGIFFCYAAVTVDASRAGSMSDALNWIRQLPLAACFTFSVAIGLAAFGICNLVGSPLSAGKVAIRRRSASGVARASSLVFEHHLPRVTGTMKIATLMSMTALLSAALALPRPTRLSTVAALFVKRAASAFGRWNLIS